MRIVRESELRSFVRDSDMSLGLRIPLTNFYILYGKSEQQYQEAKSREINFEIEFLQTCTALAR